MAYVPMLLALVPLLLAVILAAGAWLALRA